MKKKRKRWEGYRRENGGGKRKRYERTRVLEMNAMNNVDLEKEGIQRERTRRSCGKKGSGSRLKEGEDEGRVKKERVSKMSEGRKINAKKDGRRWKFED